MIKNLYYISLVLCIFLSSCNNYTGEVRTIAHKNFKIDLPDWLEETNDLAPQALFQFKSRYRNTYGIVVQSDKGDMKFQEYQHKSVGILRNYEEITNLLVTDSIFDKQEYRLELMGDIASEKVFYWHNTYESDQYFYQLVLWTRSFDRKQKYSPVIEEIISSFEVKN